MITNKYSILQYIFYFYYIVCIATFEINSLITSYSAACVPLHITFAAPIAVERRTVSSKLIPFSFLLKVPVLQQHCLLHLPYFQLVLC